MIRNANHLVSIVIPSYNHENYVKHCIQSVINQTHDNIELIIIDDGSNDNSISKIEEMTEKCNARFTRFEFRSRSNVGLCATLNEAISWCRGDFYSVLASDDLYVPSKISYQLALLIPRPDLVAVFGSSLIIDEYGNSLKISKATNKVFSFRDVLLDKANLKAPTMLARMAAIKEITPYPIDIKIEDRYTQLALTKEHNKGLLVNDHVMAHYRRHSGNSSLNIKDLLKDNIKLINLFSNGSLCNKAISNNMIGCAISLIEISRWEALKIAFKAIKLNASSIFELKFIYFIFKLIKI